MKKTLSVFFLFILASGSCTLLYLLISGRVHMQMTQQEWEEHLETVSPVNAAFRQYFPASAETSWEVTEGRSGVLFWTPELLAASETSRLAASAESISAIMAELKGRKSILILPVPLRSWYLREYLPFSGWEKLPSSSDGRKLAELLPAGSVLALEDLFDGLRASGTQLYLHRDNHWTAAAILAAAKLTGERLALLPRPHILQTGSVNGVGNLGALAGCGAETAEIFLPFPGGTLPGDAPEILLCGDSFFNIYSSGATGFGTGSGFPEILEALFYCRVLSVSIDGGGESGARSMLASLGIDPGDYDHVIWEFPVYEIQRSSWQKAPGKTAKAAPLINIAGGSSMTFTVKAAAKHPLPGSVNALYRNVLAECIASGDDGSKYLLCLPATINGIPLPLPSPGDIICAEIPPREEAQKIYSSMARESVDTDGYIMLPLIYGENVQILHTRSRQ